MTSRYQYRGDLADRSLPEILYTIDRFQVPGVVEARHKKVVKQVFLRQGYIIHASSSDRKDSLGAYLKRSGRIQEEVLVRLAERRESSNKRLGVMLLEEGLLSPADVLQAIREQIEGIIWSLFYWAEGEVTFGLGELEVDEMVQIRLPIRQVIVEGIKRAPEAKPLLARMGKKETVLEPCFEAEDLIETALDAADYQLLRSVDGSKTLYELCSQGDRNAADIAKVLYAFQVLHLVRPREARPSSPSGPVKVQLD